jgi:uncharacterized membrane protein SirB2
VLLVLLADLLPPGWAAWIGRWTTVVLSVSGFFARGLGAMGGAGWVRSLAARIVPHVVDTVLLASAVALAWQLQGSPLDAPWLLAKILGLLLYIGFGMLALRPGRLKSQRVAAFVAALAVFAYLVSVAISKNPAGYFAWIGRS